MKNFFFLSFNAYEIIFILTVFKNDNKQAVKDEEETEVCTQKNDAMRIGLKDTEFAWMFECASIFCMTIKIVLLSCLKIAWKIIA